MTRLIHLVLVSVLFLYALDVVAQSGSIEFVGGTSVDEVYGLEVDSEGNTVFCGTFREDVEFGPVSFSSYGINGHADIFVSKRSPSGEWIWTKKAGGFGVDYASGMCLDQDDNIYIVGRVKVDATFGSLDLPSGNKIPGYIAKMSPEGQWLDVERIATTDEVRPMDIVVDHDGAMYVCGEYRGAARFGSIWLQERDNQDIFVAKLSAGGVWEWAISAGGYGYDGARAIDVDADGNCYITGTFRGPADFGTDTLYGASPYLVAKIDADGQWLWALESQGSLMNRNATGHDLHVSEDGSIYTSGQCEGRHIFGTDSIHGHISLFNGVVARVNSHGEWRWANMIGDTLHASTGASLSTDETGHIYVTGSFFGQLDVDDFVLHSPYYMAGYLAKFNPTGQCELAQIHGECSSYFEPRKIAITTLNEAVIAGICEKDIVFQDDTSYRERWDVFVSNSETTTNTFDIADEHSLKIYPNPASGQITISNENTGHSLQQVRMHNIHGQLMFYSTYRSENYVLNSSHWPRGLYYLSHIDQNGLRTLRKVTFH